MIIVHLSHSLALISSCTDRREAILEKELSSSRFNFLFSQKILSNNLSWLQRAFSSSVTHKERPLGDESPLTSESEMCRDDLPMRQRPVKSPVLRLGRSSSSELEESSLEKSRSLSAAHARDIIFWNFFFLSPKRYFFLALALVTGVVPVVVVVLVGGVELLPLDAVGDEVGGVTALEAAPRRPPPLLVEPVQRVELPHQQGDLVIGDALVLLIRSCTQGRQSKLQSR
jgi:hypothetical protein